MLKNREKNIIQVKIRETLEDVRIFLFKIQSFSTTKLNRTLSLKIFFDGWYENMRFEKFYSIRGVGGVLHFENFF